MRVAAATGFYVLLALFATAVQAQFPIIKPVGEDFTIQEKIPPEEYQALMDLYRSTDGNGWTRNDNWGNGAASHWYGVNIEFGPNAFIGLNLDGKEHMAYYYTALTEYGHVTSVWLESNQLSGSIPASLGNCTALDCLHLSFNQLSGPIPASLGNCTAMTFLDLESNQLSGPIPASLGNCTLLWRLLLNENQLSGPIPASLGNLAALRTLALDDNKLSGSLPLSMANLPSGFYVNISFNSIRTNDAAFAVVTNAWSQRPANFIAFPQNPEPGVVLLVRGYGEADPFYWDTMKGFLEQDGFEVWDPSGEIGNRFVPSQYLLDGTKSVEWNASALAGFVENKRRWAEDEEGRVVQHMNIVAHSMGGVITREYMSRGPVIPVDTVVMLSPANCGSWLADIALFSWHPFDIATLAFKRMFGEDLILWPSTRNMSKRGSLLYNLSHHNLPTAQGTRYHVIAGTGIGSNPLNLVTDFAIRSWVERNWPVRTQSPPDMMTVPPESDLINDAVINKSSSHGEVTLSEQHYIFPSTPDEEMSYVDFNWYGVSGFESKETVPYNHFYIVEAPDVYQRVRSRLLGADGDNVAALDSILRQESHAQTLLTEATNVWQAVPAGGGCFGTTGVTNHPIEVDGSEEASFALLWTTGIVQFVMIDPTGTRITPASTNGNLNIQYSEDEGMALYTIRTPVSGVWTAEVTVVDLQSAIQVEYAVGVYLGNTLSFRISRGTAFQPTNSIVTILGVIQDGSTPVTNATVTGSVRKPDGTIVPIALIDDGNHEDGLANDGVYGASFSDAAEIGTYVIGVEARGRRPNGESFARDGVGQCFFTVFGPLARFTDNYADHGLDIPPTNGLFEALSIEVGVSVSGTGTYTIAGTLVSSSGAEVTSASTQITVEELGVYTTALAFASEPIYDSKVVGPFNLVNLVLLGTGENAAPLDTRSNAYATASYDWRWFGRRPDLAPISLTTSNEAVSGQELTLTCTVTNQGDAPAAGTWLDSFYLSTNTVRDASAFRLGLDLAVPRTVNAGEGYVLTFTSVLPPWPSGYYYLIATTDKGNAIIEGDEANNTRAFPLAMIVPTNGLTVSVDSAHGGAYPGRMTCEYATVVSQWLTNSPVAMGSTQYVCSGWALNGGADVRGLYSGSSTNVTLLLTNDVTLTWLWRTNYWLQTGTNGAGSVDVGSQWTLSGASTTITATVASGWQFSSWGGDTNGCLIAGNRLTAIMTQTRSIVANFAPSQVSYFDWAPVGSPQFANQPFGVTITARDMASNTVTGFEGPVTLSATRGGLASAVTPTNSGVFVSGVWTGSVMPMEAGTGVVLRAADADGHSGNADPISVCASNDLVVVALDSPDPVSIGSNVTVSISVLNSGPSDATGVVLTNVLSSDVRLVSATASQGSWVTNVGTVICDLGLLTNRAVATATVVVCPLRGGLSITNVTQVSRGEADADPFNNVAVVVTPVAVSSLTIGDAAVTEGNTGTTNALFTVTLSYPNAVTSTVWYLTLGGTALSSSDFVPTNGTLVFAPGVTSQTVTVRVNGDIAIEPNETFWVLLGVAANASVADAVGVGTIANDDGLLGQVYSFDWAPVDTPQVAGQPFGVTITAKDAASNTVTGFEGPVTLSATRGGLASAVMPTNSGVFVSGVWTGSVTAMEVGTGLVLRAADADGHSGNANPISVCDSNDLVVAASDSPDPVGVGSNVTLSISVLNFGPSDATGVVLTNVLSSDVRLVSATASQGSWVTNAGTVICNLGLLTDRAVATATMVVQAVRGGLSVTNIAQVSRGEADADPSNNVAVAVTSVRVSSLAIGDATVAEGNAGITNALFTVTLSYPSAVTSTVRYATSNGTALVGCDFVATNGTLVFAPGVTSQTVRVWVGGDIAIESNETFYVNLSGATNASIADAQGAGTIVNDDGLPGQVYFFDWAPVDTPQVAGQPIGVLITAKDASSNTVIGFERPVTLSATKGGASATSAMFSNTVHSSDGSGDYTMGQSFTPSASITVTHFRHYFGTKVSLWTDAGVLLASTTVTSMPGAWVETPLDTPVVLAAGTRYRIGAYTGSGGGSYYFRNDMSTNFANGVINASYVANGDGFPSSITTDVQWWLVDLCYQVGAITPISMMPTNTGSFVNGVWTGSVTAMEAGTGVVMRAADANGHSGTSNPFDVALVNLVVASAYGGAVPPVGTNMYPLGTSVTCRVTNSPVLNGATQYVCKGWTGTGSVPSSPDGGTNTGPITLNTDSTLTWQWVTNLSPLLVVTPASRDFGSVIVNTTNHLAFTVQNAVGGSLTGNVGGVSSPFSIVGGTNYVLSGGVTTSVTVRFAPTAAGTYSNNVSFTGGGGASRPVTGIAISLALSSLTIDVGTLTPSFSPGTLSYAASVAIAVASVTVTPVASADLTIEVRVNGGAYSPVASGTPSGTLALNVGANTIDVRVTAPDASTRTYTITVTRQSPLMIVTQPAPLAVTKGGQAVFSVYATSAGTLTYQWKKGASPIGGATNAALVINSVQYSDAGNYTVDVTDSLGTTTSSEAGLSVNSPMAGDLDFGFFTNTTVNGIVYSVAVQSDGKVLIGGEFTTVNGTTRGRVARLNSDGSTDHSFANGLAGANSNVLSVAVQSDGKVLIGGDFTNVNGTTRGRIAQLNSDGSTDHTFGNGLAGANGSVLSVAVQRDGKVRDRGQFHQCQRHDARAHCAAQWRWLARHRLRQRAGRGDQLRQFRQVRGGAERREGVDRGRFHCSQRHGARVHCAAQQRRLA